MKVELKNLDCARATYLKALEAFTEAENTYGPGCTEAEALKASQVSPAQDAMHKAEAKLAECWPSTPLDLARIAAALLSPDFGTTDETQDRMHRYAQAFVRLADFATTTGVTPPSAIVDDDGGPSVELLAFTRENHLSLDAIFRG